MSITVVLLQMIKLFIIICLGYLLFKVNILDEHTKKQLTKMLLYVTTPALIIHSFVKNMGGDNKGMLGNLFIVAGVMYIVLPLVAVLVNLVIRVKKPQQGVYMFMTVFSNVGFMGFPVVDSIFGVEGVFYAAVFNCVFNIFVFTIGIVLITYGQDKSSGSWRDIISVKKLLNPGVLCCFVSVIVFLLEIPLPAVIMDVLDSVGGLTSPLAMLLVGASLASMKLRDVFNDVRVYIYSIIKQVILPLLAWPIINRFITNDMLAAVTLILVAMPVANSAVLFATEYGSDEKTAAKTVFITTIAALVSIPFVLWVCI